MKSVEAVALDMNSDFHEAFEQRCPRVRTVFDYFHIVKNFNDKVISQIRKDEQKRLLKEGNAEAAAKLKKSRHILMSGRSLLRRKDREAREEKTVRKGSRLFAVSRAKRKGGNEEKYDALIRENRLFFAADPVKEKLRDAYETRNETQMAEKIRDIASLCDALNNARFSWFSRLLKTHFKGITALAAYRISNGKTEGINQKIKTLRRHAYGYPDDEYFFLKLFDISRRQYERNPKSSQNL